MNTKATLLAVQLLRELGIDQNASATVTVDCCDGLVALDVHVSHEPMDPKEIEGYGLELKDYEGSRTDCIGRAVIEVDADMTRFEAAMERASRLASEFGIKPDQAADKE